MTLAAIFSAIVTVIIGTVGALISLLVWFRERNVVARSKRRSEEMMQGLIGSERAADILNIEGDEDVKLTEAMTVLIGSLADTSQAVIQIGSIILIKDSGKVTIRSLKPRELRYLERHPHLFESPSVMLHALDDPTTPFGRQSQGSLSYGRGVTRRRWPPQRPTHPSPPGTTAGPDTISTVDQRRSSRYVCRQ